MSYLRIAGQFGSIMVLLLATGCSSTLPLSYVATRSVSPAAGAKVGSVTANDMRDEPDKSWYGAIRGGYGNPLKVLQANGPVSGDVAQAFRDALTRRGLLAPDNAGGYSIIIDIEQFEGSQYVRREADITLKLALTNAKGVIVYTDSAHVEKVSGSIIALDVGAFASPEDLRQLTASALSSVIDELLDKPALRAALRADSAAS